MSRPPRRFVVGQAAHVVQRGHNRAPCFFEPADQALYLSLLVTQARATGCRIHAYVLMTNHVHLLVTPDREDTVSVMMQRIGQRYARDLNRKLGRTGGMWDGRFRAFGIDSDAYALVCHVYIELNPVRAGIVDRPERYRWSSHAANAGLEPMGFLERHPSMAALGATDVAVTATYRDRVRLGLDELTLASVRHGRGLPPGVRHVSDTRGGNPLGRATSPAAR
ncbi:MAG TPA: transposase [Casimicrobiaceae bacterium]|nr:transposase [Casimicrobiaceae bacterium]